MGAYSIHNSSARRFDCIFPIDPPGRSANGPDGSAESDRSQIQGVMSKLVRPETGLYTYPMFLFLEQEFHRYERLNAPIQYRSFRHASA